MKKGFLSAVLGGIGLLIGLQSCKKNCVKCFSYTYSGGGYKFRICEDQLSAADYASYRDASKDEPGFKEVELCEK
jgi:hypothetical protein